MKKLLLLSLLLLVSLSANAQTNELVLEKGVLAHKGIDDIYRQFSEAYRALNSETVTNLYTESAAYLAPDDDILQGREKIRASFKGFFDSVRKDGRTMTISFQIFQRKANKFMAYDVGIYTLRSFKDGKEIGMGQGKFVVVAVKEKDDKWRFQVDGYSGLKPSGNK